MSEKLCRNRLRKRAYRSKRNNREEERERSTSSGFRSRRSLMVGVVQICSDSLQMMVSTEFDDFQTGREGRTMVSRRGGWRKRGAKREDEPTDTCLVVLQPDCRGSSEERRRVDKRSKFLGGVGEGKGW